MTDRYYSVEYDELYYLFDNRTYDKKELEKELEYDSCPLEYSLTDDEILNLLNQLAEMKEVGLIHVTCLNCDFYESGKKDMCKKGNHTEMRCRLLCNEWRKKK